MGSQVFIKPHGLHVLFTGDPGAVFKDLRIDFYTSGLVNPLCRVSVGGKGALLRIKKHDSDSFWAFKGRRAERRRRED